MSAPASAPAPPPISISLGVFLPSSAETRARATSALPVLEVRYALPARSGAAARTVLAVSAAHSSRGEGSTFVSGTAGLAYSLSGARSPFAASAGFAGFGAGLYGMDLNGAHTFARPGAYAEAGYNLTGTVFLNAQYRLVDRGAGVTFALGARF